MHTACPHCSQHLNLKDDELAALTADTEFNCPSCGVLIVLHPVSADFHASAGHNARLHHGLNRNLMILGAAAILLLGGIALFVASRKKGDVHNIKQDITNEVIKNRFFQDLIASGATTEKDLRAVQTIRHFGNGYVGLSKAKMTWNEAEEFAKRTASIILEIPEQADLRERSLLELDAMNDVPQGVTVWIADDFGEPMMLDVPDPLVVSTLDRQRQAILHWKKDQQPGEARYRMRVKSIEPGKVAVFDVNEWNRILIEYKNPDTEPVRIWSKYFWKGGEVGNYGNRGSQKYLNRGIHDGSFMLTQPGQVDEVVFTLTNNSNDPKVWEPLAELRVPVDFKWFYKQGAPDVEIVSVKQPSTFSADKTMTIPAVAGQRFSVEIYAQYNTPVPTKLASNLLLQEANILPPEFAAELKAEHASTWHFDTESRPGYGSVKGRGTIAYTLTGYAPREKGQYTFDTNLGLFDKRSWATKVLKLYKTTLIVNP